MIRVGQKKLWESDSACVKKRRNEHCTDHHNIPEKICCVLLCSCVI